MAMLYLRNKPIGAISSGASGGGHTIENTSGTDMEQRSDLQFVGVYTEDDSANDRTKVNVVRTMTKAQMDALSAAEKVGFIRTSDEADNPYQDFALSVQRITVVSDFSFTANTNGYLANQSFTVPTGYELIAVLNVVLTDVANKPVFLRTWFQNTANKTFTVYWSNTGSTAATGNIAAELLLKPTT